MRGYPKWFSFYFITVTLSCLFLSGLLLAPSTLELRLQWRVPWRLVGSEHSLVAVMHVFIGLIVIGIVGALWSIHMRQEWRMKRNRSTGTLLVIAFALLSFSGIAIYYVTNELWLSITSLSHLCVGVGICVIYVWHSLFFKAK